MTMISRFSLGKLCEEPTTETTLGDSLGTQSNQAGRTNLKRQERQLCQLNSMVPLMSAQKRPPELPRFSLVPDIMHEIALPFNTYGRNPKRKFCLELRNDFLDITPKALSKKKD